MSNFMIELFWKIYSSFKSGSIFAKKLPTCSLIAEQGFGVKVEMSSGSTMTLLTNNEFKSLSSIVLSVDIDYLFARWVTCKKLTVYILTKMFFLTICDINAP